MINYKTKTIGFVFDLRKNDAIITIKKELVDFIKQIEVSDSAYIYNESGLCFPKLSQTTRALGNYVFSKSPSIPMLLRDALTAMVLETNAEKKTVYVFSDGEFQDMYHMQKIMKIAERSGCRVLFFCLKEQPGLTVTVLESFNEIGKLLQEDYKCQTR